MLTITPKLISTSASGTKVSVTVGISPTVLPGAKGYSTLLVLTVGVLISIALELLIKQVRAHMVERACKAIDQELSAVFFGKALDIRMDARPRTVGTFASQIRHFESVRSFLTSSTLFILADAPFALLFVLVIAMISWQVALVPLVMVPLAILVGLSFRKPIEKYTGLHMAESNRKNGLLIEAIDGIESIKAANGEWKQLDRWRHLTATIAQGELHMRALSTLSTNITQVMQQITYVGMVTVGAYAITVGELTMGGLIACTIISGRALSPLAQFPGLIVQWKHAQIALKGLDGIMAMPSDREDNARLVVPESCDGFIKLQQTTFAYGQDKPILEVESLNIRPGERIAVVGAVGSGKSTLVKLLSGLYKPSSGTVYLDDVDLNQLAPEYVREYIGYLPQDVRLFNGTLRENLTLGLPTPRDSVILRTAKFTGLAQAIALFVRVHRGRNPVHQRAGPATPLTPGVCFFQARAVGAVAHQRSAGLAQLGGRGHLACQRRKPTGLHTQRHFFGPHATPARAGHAVGAGRGQLSAVARANQGRAKPGEKPRRQQTQSPHSNGHGQRQNIHRHQFYLPPD